MTTRAAVDDALNSLQAAAGATGNGTALVVLGWDGVLFQFTGSSPVGTITWEGTADGGTTWVSIEAYNIADGTVATTATAVGDFVAVCAGLDSVRARISAFTSGTFTVKARAFPGATAAALVGSSATSGGTSNVNVAKINNVTPLMGAGNTGTGSQRVTIATDQVTIPVSLAANATYGTVATGEVAGATSVTVNPTVACKEVTIKAAYDNAGRVYIGVATATKADGTTDTTTGIQLSAGEAITLPISNLNLTYRICDNAGDDFTYIALT